MKKITYTLILMSVFIQACASKQKKIFEITSTPAGAKIDVNGIYMGKTPVTVDFECSKHWVGLAYSSDGWGYDGSVYNVEAFPTENGGTSQRKSINACHLENDKGRLDFDLRLDSVTPVQRYKIEHK